MAYFKKMNIWNISNIFCPLYRKITIKCIYIHIAQYHDIKTNSNKDDLFLFSRYARIFYTKNI